MKSEIFLHKPLKVLAIKATSQKPKNIYEFSNKQLGMNWSSKRALYCNKSDHFWSGNPKDERLGIK